VVTMPLAVMVVLAEAPVVTKHMPVVLKFKLVNQATVEHTDLEMLVVLVTMGFLIIRLPEAAVPVQLGKMVLVLVQVMVEMEKI